MIKRNWWASGPGRRLEPGSGMPVTFNGSRHRPGACRTAVHEPVVTVQDTGLHPRMNEHCAQLAGGRASLQQWSHHPHPGRLRIPLRICEGPLRDLSWPPG